MYQQTAGLVRNAGKNYYWHPSMVACWLFDEGVGTVTKDRLIYNNHITGISGPDWVDDGLDFEYSSLDFLDVDDFYTFGIGDWTVNTWVKLEDGVNYGHIFTADDQPDFACKIAKNSSSPLRYPYFYSSETGVIGGGGGIPLDLATWYMLTYRRSGNVISIVINGVVDRVGDANGLDVTTTNFKIGKYSTEGLDGIIHSLAVYSSSISDAILRNVYNAGMYRTKEHLQYAI